MPVFERTSSHDLRLEAGLKARLRREARFRAYGLLAVSLAASMLIMLLLSISVKSFSAFTEHQVTVRLSSAGQTTRETYTEVRRSLLNDLKPIESAREVTNQVGSLISVLAVEHVVTNDKRYSLKLPLISAADAYLKGRGTGTFRLPITTSDGFGEGVAVSSEAMTRIFERLNLATEEQFENGSLVLTNQMPSVLLFSGSHVGQVTSIKAERVFVQERFEPQGLFADEPFILIVERPQAKRLLSDVQILALEVLRETGQIGVGFNTSFFISSDSTEAELSGILAALVSSLLIIALVAAFAIPLGIASALYLEEFSQNGRIKSIITVNINNLAAVPNIVYGLLGAAILINGIDLPIPFTELYLRIGGGMGRGWPIVGGIVLALSVLPTVIITSRAAIRAVPRFRREAALALGATRMQMVRDHILPQSLPGMMTGSIIGLAQAVGEAAPLLMLGMFAFIAEPPQGVTDRASALPVLIYQWSTRADQAWEPLTAAAIIVLLLFMLLMNAVAVWLRVRYEGRRV